MQGTHNHWLLLLSVIVSVMASFVALDSTARVAASRTAHQRAGADGGRQAWYWLLGGAFAMGTGIWSMHFIGMLGYDVGTPLSFAVAITCLSFVIALVASGFALFWVSHGSLGAGKLLLGGLLMGGGISAMHYTGMAALEMDPPIRYQWPLVVMSLAIALFASFTALWTAFKLREETFFTAIWKKTGSAIVMGAAIFGMHYTAMAAAIFDPNSVSTAASQHIDHVWLAGALGAFALVYMVATLAISALDAFLAAQSTRYAEDLETRIAERTAEISRTNEALRRSDRTLRALVEERERLARDLHDHIVQAIYAVGMKLEELQHQSAQHVAAQLADVVAGLNDVLRNLREYIAGEPRELRSGEQFRAELARLVEPAERGTAPRFEVDIDSAAFERLTPDEAQQLLSITREALSNALRHSRAKSGRVALRANAGDVELEVSDDGVGFDVEAMRREAGGLHNIASRAREIGARLEIHASPQEGSRITVTIPKQVRGHDRGRNN